MTLLWKVKVNSPDLAACEGPMCYDIQERVHKTFLPLYAGT